MEFNFSTDPVNKLNEDSSLAIHFQNALGFSFPPVVPLKNAVRIDDGRLQKLQTDPLFKVTKESYITPITFRLDSEPETGGFSLPTDPIVSFSGKNSIAKRRVSKGTQAGTIKEHWTRDDWDITINGLLISDDFNDKDYYVTELLRYCESRNSIHVICELFNSVFNVDKIAIESFDFPFTKGEDYQMFSIKASSDEVYNLLIEKSDV